MGKKAVAAAAAAAAAVARASRTFAFSLATITKGLNICDCRKAYAQTSRQAGQQLKRQYIDSVGTIEETQTQLGDQNVHLSPDVTQIDTIW